jgi:hypothetical protein
LQCDSDSEIPAELIQAEDETLRSEFCKHITSIWSKEELPEQWKKPINVSIYRNGDKTDCSNYRGISLLSTSYKMLSNILPSRLSPYADEIIRDHQCKFRRNMSTADQPFTLFPIRQTLGGKMGVQ